MAVTKRGLELADRLARHMDWEPETADVCSRIVRHATTYNRIQEMWTSVEMSDAAVARTEQSESAIEQRLRELVAELPATRSGHRFAVEFAGDPRGFTVRLVADDGWTTVGVA